MDSMVIDNLDSVKQIHCQVGQKTAKTKADDGSTGTKSKRKARSTRRRLNALMNNTSLHFSDTDSEGELIQINTASPMPTISVTADGTNQTRQLNLNVDETYNRSRRNSYIDNLTDVDEIYPSDEEDKRAALIIKPVENPQFRQSETDVEDYFSNGEDDEFICVVPRSDILCFFSGETVTTKEGDGPFSVEVRNRMSVDEPSIKQANTPDIVIMPTTDTEEMEASEDDDYMEGACGQDSIEDLDILAASQIVMKNVSKVEHNLLGVRDADDGASDGHTDVEDLE